MFLLFDSLKDDQLLVFEDPNCKVYDNFGKVGKGLRIAGKYEKEINHQLLIGLFYNYVQWERIRKQNSFCIVCIKNEKKFQNVFHTFFKVRSKQRQHTFFKVGFKLFLYNLSFT